MMKLTHILQKTAHQYPDRPGITFQGRTRSWGQVLQRCEQLAGGLGELGLKPGERMAIISHNSDVMAELFFGPLWQGIVPVPLNWRWALPELLACLEDCAPAVLAVDEAHVSRARELQGRCPSIRTLIYTGKGEVPDGFLGYESLVNHAQQSTT